MLALLIIVLCLIYLSIGIFALGYWRTILHAHSSGPYYSNSECKACHMCYEMGFILGLIWPASWLCYLIVRGLGKLGSALFRLGVSVSHAGESFGKRWS